MKLNNGLYNYTILLLFCCLFLTITNEDTGKSWCWTESMANEPSFILDKSLGGLNWGYCDLEGTPPIITYVALVSTSQIEKSETNSVVKIQIHGSKGKTKSRVLSSTGFERGSERRVVFEADDVGKVEKITMRVSGNSGYRCSNILLQKGNFSTRFECLKRVEPCKPGEDPKDCTLEMQADGETPYEVSVKTSEEDDSGTTSPLFLQLKGSKGESRMKILSEMGLETGGTETITINIRDIGEVSGLKFYLGAAGKWKPTYMTVKNLITGIMKVFELPDAVLISPGSDTYTLDQSETKSDPPAGDDSQDGTDSGEGASDAMNVHNPYGGLINQTEKKKIVNLSCDQKLMNPSVNEMIFGPDYPTRNINYFKILAKCPSDCHKIPGTVIGVGMHPETSPICLSALVDRAISFYGGIISISIFPGMDSYNVPSGFPKKVFQIYLNSLSSKSIMKSYVVSKVDNLDLVEKDLRIVDHNGNLAAEGRVEIRMEGKWGSFCSSGNNLNSAIVLCKNLGYIGGEWKSPNDEDGRNYCQDFKGFDYCAANDAKIHFTKIDCAKSDVHINTCNKEIADKNSCTHGLDAIINCFNENYETNRPIPVGVVRLAAIVIDKENFTGRLEMFNQQKFSPICLLRFNNASASIACKQMGYKAGSHITDNSIAESIRLNEDSDESFSASNVNCRGNEKSLKECQSTMTDIKCKHDQDVVVKCEGMSGDATGRSQYAPKPITAAPKLGKLGISRRKIKCNTRGNHPSFRGDPGSVFLLDCPANCLKEPGIISGTGLYTSDSNICMAALHAGVIDDKIGGLFAFIKSFGQAKSESTSRYGITSSQLSMQWISAFSISEVNSGWMAMNKLYEDGSPANMRNKDAINTSFIEFGSLTKLSIPKLAFRFIQPTPNFLFNEKENILKETNPMARLSSYSIIARFKMTKFNGAKQFIFSYSGCQGFNILIDEEDSLVLGDFCTSEKVINTRINIPTNESITLYVSYDKNNIKVIVKSAKLGTITKNFSQQLEINPGREIGIGRLGLANKNAFFGEIRFIFIFEGLIDEAMIPKIIEKLKFDKNSGLAEMKTEDGRKCLSPCIDASPAGEGSPPENAKLDAGSDTNNVPLEKITNGFGTYDKTEDQETLQIDCDTNLSDYRFTGGAGKLFRVHCPVCTVSKSIVFGTGVYHPISSICKSAMHFGNLKKGQQGDFIVEISGAKPVFTGSIGKDNSISASFAKADRSFVVRKAKKYISIPCERKASEDVFSSAAISAKFVVSCAKNCSKSKKSVIFGSEVYTDTSPICVAAIHYGILTDKGGEVEFIIEGEQSSFKSTKGFGLISKPKGYYVRSYRFLGHRSSLSFKFKEDYKGKLLDKWKTEIDSTAIDKDKDSWSYKLENRPNQKGMNEKFSTIMHTGPTRMTDEFGYASWITLKNSDFANGIIKFNLKFVDTNPIGLLFRYNDSENYYGIQFNLKNTKSNVRLIAKINSSIKVIKSKNLMMLQSEKWFRCTLILNFEEVKFLIQQEDARENKLVFSNMITELNRGTIGFGVNGNTHVFISGVSIDNYTKNTEGKTLGNLNKMRTFEDLLKRTEIKEIKAFCSEIYKKMSRDYDRCTQPHTFCMTKCDSVIPFPQEKIINFKCFRDCVKIVYDKNAAKLDPNTDNNSATWEPKAGNKIDMLINGETNYRPGTVLSLKTQSNNKMLTIEYMSDVGDMMTVKMGYPSPSIVNCGSKLSQRKDCAEVKATSYKP